MNKQQEEKILNEKLEIILNQTTKLQSDYDSLFSQTIDTRESLSRLRSSLKTKEVNNELRKINKYISKCNKINKRIKLLKISYKSPYFACITFDNENYYIGKIGVRCDEDSSILINDWRAPISNLFYEFETGPAFYIVPGVAKIEGVIQNKKQYKIQNSKMIYCFETNINIEDEILQKTLAENSSEHMKTIVLSIQREQNQIIRKSKDETLIVQGVAGSGKTSIALHRIAFLLYNNKKVLKSNNVLIFSPNKVFSSYISTVLPELGESRAKETNIDEILQENFGGVIEFYNKFENIEMLLKNQNLAKLHDFKTSFDFYEKLKNYLSNYMTRVFKTKSIKAQNIVFEKEQISNLLQNAKGETFDDKLNCVADNLIDIINVNTPLKTAEENSIRNILKIKLCKCIDKQNKNILKIYKEFLQTQNLTINLKKKLNFDDAIIILFVKNYIFGATINKNISHVVIDELQDYSPVALAIIEQTYPCTKTALGDVNQTIDSSPNKNYLLSATSILKASANPISLLTVYRSTKQIAEFCNEILNLKDVKLINRNGDNVELLKTEEENYFSFIKSKVEQLKQEHKSIAIITKTFRESYDIGKALKIKVISPITQRYKTGVIATPAYLAKGLEFDAAIVCNANEENFKTELDKQQLYVACTRPLHKLSLIYTNKLTSFIKQKKN